MGEGQLRDTENDFLVLSSRHSNRDRFERWTGDTLLRAYHRLIGQRLKVSRILDPSYHVLTKQKTFIKDEEFGLTEYSDAKISVAADVLCTLFAPLLTTIPMFVLYFVSDIKIRLGIIMGFTTLFSIRYVVWPLSKSSSSSRKVTSSQQPGAVFVCKENRDFRRNVCLRSSPGCLWSSQPVMYRSMTDEQILLGMDRLNR